MKSVYLISCTKRKQKYCCKAEEMYAASNLFKSSLEYALNRVRDKKSQIFILSAKHHLITLSEVIEPYDKTLKNMKKCEVVEWGKTVYNQMKEIFDMENVHFIFLAGNDYIKPLIPYLGNNMYSNPIPTEHRRYAKRIKWLEENK